MDAKLQLITRGAFGFPGRAQLNGALMEALAAWTVECETCRLIGTDTEANAEGGEYAPSPSFPGMTIQRLDAHFKSHGKGEYGLVDRSGRRPGG